MDLKLHRRLYNLFIRHLIKENLYSKFVANCYNIDNNEFELGQQSALTDLKERLCELSKKHLYEIIDYGFTWSDTPEGHDHWSFINNNWQDICYRMKVEQNREEHE